MIIKTPYPVVRGHCGTRLYVFQGMLAPSQIIALLGHDPTDPKKLKDEHPEIAAIYEEVQRGCTSERRRSIADYMQSRMTSNATQPGAFPAICVGLFEPQEFTAIASDPNLGYLQIDSADPRKGLMLDGLGRTSGSRELFKRKVDVNAMLTFPVTFIVPVRDRLTVAEMGILFHDFNYLASPVKAEHALALAATGGGGNLYLKLAYELSQKPVIVNNGGVEKRAKSRGKKSTSLVTLGNLMRFVRGACEGAKAQESNREHIENPNLTTDTYGQLLANLENYLDGIAKRMGGNFREPSSILLTAPGWQSLGLVFHDFTYRLDENLATPQAYVRMLDGVAGIDWSRYNPDWIGMLGEIERKKGVAVVDERGRTRVALGKAGRTNRATLHAYVQQKTGIDQLLARQSSVAA